MLARRLGPVICYWCGEAGHFKRECPKKLLEVYPLGLKMVLRMQEHVGFGREKST